ncbi:MAG: hypothetical protein DRP78_06465, partial [Candidatus Omnitrophota bacterium]
MDIKNLFSKVFNDEISDIHLCTGLPPMIRQVHGLFPWGDVILKSEDVMEILNEIIPSNIKIGKKFEKEIDLGIDFCGIRFRINIYEDRRGICAALRLIPQT